MVSYFRNLPSSKLVLLFRVGKEGQTLNSKTILPLTHVDLRALHVDVDNFYCTWGSSCLWTKTMPNRKMGQDRLAQTLLSELFTYWTLSSVALLRFPDLLDRSGETELHQPERWCWWSQHNRPVPSFNNVAGRTNEPVYQVLQGTRQKGVNSFHADFHSPKPIDYIQLIKSRRFRARCLPCWGIFRR